MVYRQWRHILMLVLPSEIPSGMCAKLSTVAASNNRVHMPWPLYYCLFGQHICMVLFFTHIPFVVNHTFNATPPERLHQHPLLFTTNHTDSTFFVWRLTLARPSHPGHSTILLRSEIPSGMCAKLCTVAANNNRVHMLWSLYFCLFAPHICMVLFFTHIPFVANHTFTATTPERLQYLWSHSCQFKLQTIFIFFWRALVPPTLKKVPPPLIPCTHQTR